MDQGICKNQGFCYLFCLTNYIAGGDVNFLPSFFPGPEERYFVSESLFNVSPPNYIGAPIKDIAK